MAHSIDNIINGLSNRNIIQLARYGLTTTGTKHQRDVGSDNVVLRAPDIVSNIFPHIRATQAKSAHDRTIKNGEAS
ncbi:hypothetical protein FACS189449_09830 [Alphaproteobacteria bacterium]|nr:hypothetical protein FACS189449_09830 [Alphaproteobacteria bacterium]